MNKRFAVDGVDALTPLRAAAPALLTAKATPLFELEDLARGGADMDAVHDMRVASRRLREAMRLLAPIYPSREFKAWYGRVRRITRVLGPVRDSDVFIAAFAKMILALGEPGQRCVTFLVGYRMGQRLGELERLNRELSTLDLAQNRKAFRQLARAVVDSPEASRPLADFAHAAVAERAATVFRAQPVALDEANVEQQHALRIDYKRLRYAVEAFAPCYEDDFDELHEVLTAFQDALGDLHDVHVFLDMLREPARIEAAQRAGVTSEGIAEVEAVLESHTRAEFARFTSLAANHPEESLLSALLLPLSRESGTAGPHTQDLALGAVTESDDPPIATAPIGDEPWSLEWSDGMPVALLATDAKE